MKEEHERLLEKLIKNKSFPVTKKNTTEEERLMIKDIEESYTKNELKKFMHELMMKHVKKGGRRR